MSDLWQRLLVDSRSFVSGARFWTKGGYVPAPWPDLIDGAARIAAGLRANGVGPGTRVAMVLTNERVVLEAMTGVWMCGGAVASLPVRVAGVDLAVYREQLRTILVQLEPTALLVDATLGAQLAGAVPAGLTLRTYDALPVGPAVEPDPPGPDDLAFIQYSSGSTGSPKGCMLTASAIGDQLGALAELTAPQPGEVGVSWLPWSHDMGLFGGLLSGWWNDVTTYFSTPQRFLMSPRTWIEDLARYGGRYTAGTPTALQVAARVTAMRSSELPGSLAGVEAMIIGAERIHWEVLEEALADLARFGLRPEALMPAYGLAEGTLAVTATPLTAQPHYVAMDSVALAEGRLRRVDPAALGATKVVSAGPVCRGAEIVSPRPGDDRVAPIRIRSTALSQGYFGDQARTRRLFDEGILDTGDLGFVIDGELYPIGRSDDVVAVAGRNVNLREVEAAIEIACGLRRSTTVLVDGRAGGRLWLTLLVEAGARTDRRAVARAAATAALAAGGGLDLNECVFVRRNALPRTPSGKIQRHRCRRWLLDGTGPESERIVLGDEPETETA